MIVLALALISGCGKADVPPPAKEVDSAALFLKITDLPPGWDVTTNDSDGLVLAPTNSNLQGRVAITVGPEEEGINLVAAVDEHKEAIEAKEGGAYSGAQELSGPLGSAFYSRGRFIAGGAQIEETRIFALHPTTSRMLILEYTYPAGDDSAARVNELIELFSLIE